MRQRCLLSLFLFNGIPSQSNKTREKIKDIQIEKSNYSYFAADMILYLKDPEDSTKKSDIDKHFWQCNKI
jgi:hypothetical protein